MQVKQGVTLTGRNTTGPPCVLTPSELRCICAAVECYRRLQTTDDDNRRLQTPESITNIGGDWSVNRSSALHVGISQPFNSSYGQCISVSEKQTGRTLLLTLVSVMTCVSVMTTSLFWQHTSKKYTQLNDTQNCCKGYQYVGPPYCRPKCTLYTLHAAPWWVQVSNEYADKTDRRTEARPLQYAFHYGRGQHNNPATLRQNPIKQGVALTERKTTGPPCAAPDELRCICAVLQTTTDNRRRRRRRQRQLNSLPPPLHYVQADH